MTAAPFTLGDFELVYDPSAGEAERWYVNDHTIYRDHAGTWHLVGITHAEPANPFAEVDLCHATAPAITGPWTKQAHTLTADPAAGETQLWAPHVIEHGGRFWMFVCAGGAEKDSYRLHLATSEDGWSWERHPANPVVVDGFEARDPMVLRVGDRWAMYYTATSEPEGGNHVVAVVTSEDLVRWSDRRIVLRDPMVGTGAGPTESPFVVPHDGGYLLFVGPDYGELVRSFEETGRYDLRAYRRTRVLASADPFHFDPDDVVAVIDSHAAEVVHDPDAGTWWVTHCGWGQGGVFVAPLTWT